jgi:putative toxin-antitoxin system antitoxin component (TIGR02293 family)
VLGSIPRDGFMKKREVWLHAVKLYDGNILSAKKWMRSSCRALNGLTPDQMCKTEEGRQLVDNLIGRLEHGVYS